MTRAGTRKKPGGAAGLRDADRLLTKAEVSTKVRRPIATLNFWRTRGIGPRSALIGGRVLYRESDVDAWIASEIEADTAYVKPAAG